MKQQDLIFDVGMHRGEDTDFYLRKGFRVVALEADPNHTAFCRDRFREFIDSAQLTIVEGAIVDAALSGSKEKTVSFFKNEDVSVWGTVRSEWAHRYAKCGAASQSIEVPAIDFNDVLRTYGIPHYLKIDIEGSDLICVHALKNFPERPDYISLESDKTSFKRIEQEINLLHSLGYTGFQAIEQSAVVHQIPGSPSKEGRYINHRFELGSSGLFGAELDGVWKSRDEILRQYRMVRLGYYFLAEDGILTGRKSRGLRHLAAFVERALRQLTKNDVPGWYDTHARLDQNRRLNQTRKGLNPAKST